MKNSTLLSVVVTCAMTCSVFGSKDPADRYTKIVDTRTPVPGYSTFAPLPDSQVTFDYLYEAAVDESEVAFIGGFSVGIGPTEDYREGIYRYKNGAIESIVTPAASNAGPEPAAPFSILSSLVFEDGEVYFFGASDAVQGIYKKGDGDLETVVRTAISFPGTGEETYRFNSIQEFDVSGGALAFIATTEETISGGGDPHDYPVLYEEGIYILRDGKLTRVVDEQTRVPGYESTFEFFRSVSVDGQRIAFCASFEADPPGPADSEGLREGVFLYANGEVKKVADEGFTIPGSLETFWGFGDVVVRNERVAFLGYGPADEELINYESYDVPVGVYVFEQGKVSSLVGPVIDSVYGFSFNGTHMAMAVSSDEKVSSGIYSDISGPFTKHIEESDELDGMMVTSGYGLELSRDGLYKRSVVFNAELYSEERGFITAIYRGELAGPPAPSTPLFPSDEVLELRKPLFTWEGVSEASWYLLWIEKEGELYTKIWVNEVTTWSPGEAFPCGSFTWWVLSWNKLGSGSWSAPAHFEVQCCVPNRIVELASYQVIEGLKPVFSDVYHKPEQLGFTWLDEPCSTHVQLWVNHKEKKWFTAWYELADLPEDPVIYLERDYPRGTYTYWLRAWSPDGYGPWSESKKFTVTQGCTER